MKLQDVKAKVNADTVSVKNGVYTVRRGFFYRMGGTAEAFAARVRAAFPDAEILDSGEVWKAFSGGAPVAKQSHWFVKFRLAAK